MDDEDREDLGNLLDSVVQWQLPDDGWDRVDRALATIDGALDGASDALHRAEAELMTAGSIRAGKGLHDTIDKPTLRPAAANTRDLVGRLLHRLGSARTRDNDPA